MDNALSTDKDKLLLELKGHISAVVADKIEEKFNTFHERKELSGTMEEVMAAAGTMVRSHQRAAESLPGNLDMARVMLCRGASERSRDLEPALSAGTIAERLWADDGKIKAFVTTGNPDTGTLLQELYFEEFYEALVPRVAVRSMNPMIVPMPGEALNVMGFDKNVSGHYVGEGRRTQGTAEPKASLRRLSRKKLISSVAITNEYLNHALTGSVSRQVLQFIQRGALRQQAVTEDFHFLRSPGTQHTPKGLRYWASTEIPWSGALDFNTALQYLGKMISTLESNNVDSDSAAFFMSNNFKNWLKFAALDGFQRPFFLQMMLEGELLGARYASSTQIPNNLGSGDETDLTLAAMEHILLGEGTNGEITADTRGAFIDQNGEIQSAADMDVTVLRVKSTHDLMPDHDEAVIVGTKIPIGSWMPA